MDTNELLREYQTASIERKHCLEGVILERNYGLAVFIAQQYFSLFNPNGGDDAIQEAAIAMLRGIL